jgi:hypothetical protein
MYSTSCYKERLNFENTLYFIYHFPGYVSQEKNMK